MPDSEKVIRAWEIFRKSNPYEICNGREFRAFAEPEYCMGQMIEDTISLLNEQEAVVRCKDCKRYYANGGNCDQVLAEWFCADGERKEGQ